MAHVDRWQNAVRQLDAQRQQPGLQCLIQRRHAIVIEARGHGAKHRHLVRRSRPGFLVALHLFRHVAQCVKRAFAVKLVDSDELRKVQHVYFFQLTGGAKLGRHHIQRHVHMGHDGRIALTYARGLDDDQIKACHLAGRNHVGQGLADLRAKVAGGE